MSLDLEQLEQESTESYEQYRALSSLAVASVILGVIGLGTFVAWWMVAVPVLGILLGMLALRRIRRNPHELTGTSVAFAGILTCAVFGSLGFGYKSYEYATEVPEGYERISYAELQPDPETPEVAIPDSAMALRGKKVFIKGYVYPGGQTAGIKRFLLVRDQGDCCFGGDPKITDRIYVTLEAPLSLTYSTRLHKLAGTFDVQPTHAPDGIGGGVFYRLKANHLE